jgi:hypothetical protein
MVHVSTSPPYDPGRSAFPSPVLASALHAIFQRQAFLVQEKLKWLAHIHPILDQLICPPIPTFPRTRSQHCVWGPLEVIRTTECPEPLCPAWVLPSTGVSS